MLTADLIPARIRGGVVRPFYVDRDDPQLQSLAEDLIAIFEGAVGESRETLEARLAEYSGHETEFVLHRGLARLLEARCRFEVESPLDPPEFRREVFEASAAAWREPPPEDRPFRFDRDEVMAKLGESLNLAPATLEAMLFADLKSEQRLVEWKDCEASWLIDRYNVALAQGVLLRASQLRIELGRLSAKKQRALFRRLKFFRLLFRVESKTKAQLNLVLDGPLCLFKASQRYGMQMAAFLPVLLHMEKWTLEARILWGKKRYECSFHLADSDGLVPFDRLQAQWQPEELAGFLERFQKTARDWTVSEDTPLIVLPEQGVLLPDFVFHHTPSGFEVTMEALGYWRKNAVEARISLLEKGGVGKAFVLALSRGLATDREALDRLPATVYLYRTRPIAKDVLALLEEIRSSA